jgi:hypothetical protein
MTDGINTDGFSNTGEQSGSNTIDAKYSPNPKSAFPAKDMSSQGNAGLNQEGSSAAGESSSDASEMLS